MRGPFRSLISDILSSGLLEKLKAYPSHSITGPGDRASHCLRTAYLAYRMARFLRADEGACARAGLLHDVGYEPGSGVLEAILGHAGESARVARELGEEEAVVRAVRDHMFPISGRPPSSRVALVVWLADKLDSLLELLGLTGWLDKVVGFGGP